MLANLGLHATSTLVPAWKSNNPSQLITATSTRTERIPFRLSSSLWSPFSTPAETHSRSLCCLSYLLDSASFATVLGARCANVNYLLALISFSEVRVTRLPTPNLQVHINAPSSSPIRSGHRGTRIRVDLSPRITPLRHSFSFHSEWIPDVDPVLAQWSVL